MVYIKSADHLSYRFNGQVVPANTRGYLEVTDDTLAEFKQSKVFNALVKSKNILVLTKKPASVGDTLLEAQNLVLAEQRKTARLEAELSKLKAEIKESKKKEKKKEE